MRHVRPTTSVGAICFNPRTHVGCDLKDVSLKATVFVFQSTHPRGVRHKTERGRPGEGCFNPRTHVGCDGIGRITPIFCEVSIHAPTWGATEKTAYCRLSFSVSIHAPTWGATENQLVTSSTGGFQSTHPRGVRHSQPYRAGCLHLRFNPRTHVGCDSC